MPRFHPVLFCGNNCGCMPLVFNARKSISTDGLKTYKTTNREEANFLCFDMHVERYGTFHLEKIYILHSSISQLLQFYANFLLHRNWPQKLHFFQCIGIFQTEKNWRRSSTNTPLVASTNANQDSAIQKWKPISQHPQMQPTSVVPSSSVMDWHKVEKSALVHFSNSFWKSWMLCPSG